MKKTKCPFVDAWLCGAAAVSQKCYKTWLRCWLIYRLQFCRFILIHLFKTATLWCNASVPQCKREETDQLLYWELTINQLKEIGQNILTEEENHSGEPCVEHRSPEGQSAAQLGDFLNLASLLNKETGWWFIPGVSEQRNHKTMLDWSPSGPRFETADVVKGNKCLLNS